MLTVQGWALICRNRHYTKHRPPLEECTTFLPPQAQPDHTSMLCGIPDPTEHFLITSGMGWWRWWSTSWIEETCKTFIYMYIQYIAQTLVILLCTHEIISYSTLYSVVFSTVEKAPCIPDPVSPGNHISYRDGLPRAIVAMPGHWVYNKLL